MPRNDFIGIVGGALVNSTYEFARPADTNAYAANDSVTDSTTAPNSIIFSGIGRVQGGAGYITKVQINTDAAIGPRYRLWLYNVAPSGIPDNTGHALLFAERNKSLGYIDISSGISGATVYNTTTCSISDNARLPYVCSATGTYLYGTLVTLDAFTPKSAQNFSIQVTADQN